MCLKQIFVVCFLVLLLTGCQGGKINGYIMEVDEGSLLIIEGATEEEVSEWKVLSFDELIDMRPAPSLLVVRYENADDFQVGDYVKINLEGDIAASYPGQASAKNVELVEE